jgi:hypothetical protein
MNRSEHKKFKKREFLGDRLLIVIVTSILFDKNYTISTTSSQTSRFVKNSYLSAIFDKAKLQLPSERYTVYYDEIKLKGNAVEEYIWNYFLENGFEKTKEWFIINSDIND